MAEKRQRAVNRRNFLRAFGGASTGAVATGVLAFDARDAQAYDPGEDETRTRYQETEHVKAFYRVNGYQTLDK